MTTPAYRERRRRAKLRRRARDRDVHSWQRGQCTRIGDDPHRVARHRARDCWTRKIMLQYLRMDMWYHSGYDLRGLYVGPDVSPWWATAEGRRAWLAADRDAKRDRKAYTSAAQQVALDAYVDAARRRRDVEEGL